MFMIKYMSPSKIKELYLTGMSSQEIKDTLQLPITVRQVQRIVKSYGITRSVKEAFNNAVKRNRIHWHYKTDKIKRHKISPKLRYQILERDNFTCVLCGSKQVLEVDHIDENKNNNTITNLQTLCHECNIGKHWNN